MALFDLRITHYTIHTHATFRFCLAGKIRVFIEYQKEPLAIAADDEPLPIKYFGFASYDNSLAKFFYNCEGENAYGEADIKDLCRYAEARENEYKEFFKITDITGVRSEGYIINFPFYIRAERDAHVLLTKGPMANREDFEYEICNYILFCQFTKTFYFIIFNAISIFNIPLNMIAIHNIHE